MRQSALIATPAAPYKAPAIVGWAAIDFRQIKLKRRIRIPPAIVLPRPQAKPAIHGEIRTGLPGGLSEAVSSVRLTTTRNAAAATERTICLDSRPAGVPSCAAIQTSAIANRNCEEDAPQV